MHGGVIIREARRRAALSQRQLAERLATEQSVVARWEACATSPTYETVAAACAACGFTLDWTLRPVDADQERVLLEQRRRTPAERVAGVVNLAALRRAVPESPGPFRPVDLLRVLVENQVAFILIGGLAATVHGSPYATVDVDVVPRRDPPNLGRLSDALRALATRVYVSSGETLVFTHDARSLGEVAVWNLSTTYGGLDITFTPAGTRGYADLAERAESVDLGGVEVMVAALEDIVRSKAAAGREKDLVVLPALRRLLALQIEERRRRQGRPP